MSLLIESEKNRSVDDIMIEANDNKRKFKEFATEVQKLSFYKWGLKK
jgi:hypothetical protein